MARRLILPRSFYRRDPRLVARELLNKLLVHADPDVGRLAVRIVEVEAYLGDRDPASHAYRGQTRRNATLFGPPGRLYVYFTYGMHWCANVVCLDAGRAGAVLLRAGAPVEGMPAIAARRPGARRPREITGGPARLTQALGITGVLDASDLRRGPVRVLDDGLPPSRRPRVTTRIGLRPGEGDRARWRWCVPGDPHVSRPEPH